MTKKDKTYLVFIVKGYDKMLTDGTLLDVVSVELIDKTAESAIKRAQKMVSKPEWRVSQIIENYRHANSH